jgi:hypothetical protein
MRIAAALLLLAVVASAQFIPFPGPGRAGNAVVIPVTCALPALSSWSLSGATLSGDLVTAVGGDANINSPAASCTLTAGLTYRLQLDMRTDTSASLGLHMLRGGNWNCTGCPGTTVNGTWTTYYSVPLTPSTSGSGTEVNYLGGWGTFNPSAAFHARNMQVVQMVPSGSELLSATGDFSNAAWVKGTMTVAGDNTTMTGTSGDSYVYQDATVTSGQYYITQVTLRAVSPTTGNIQVSIVDGGVPTYWLCPVTTSYTTCEVVHKSGSTTNRIYVGGWSSWGNGVQAQVSKASFRPAVP